MPEILLDTEDMRRRCEAHGQWMREHPEAAAFSEAWADRNLDELAQRRPPYHEETVEQR